MEQYQYPNPPQQPPRKGNGPLWFVLGVMFAALILMGVAFFFWYTRLSGNGTGADKDASGKIPPQLAVEDGSYFYEGVWDDGGTDPQPCRLSFTKKDGRLRDCLYTNLKWTTTIRLTGEQRNDSLRFTGKIGNDDLVICLAPKGRNGKELSGTGVDYAHQGSPRVLRLYAVEGGVAQPETPAVKPSGGPGPSIEMRSVNSGNVVALTGSIGQYNVHMDLSIDGSDVSGSYYYRSSGSGARLYLRGSLYSNGEMVLTETNDEGAMTGRFDGTYQEGRGFEGLFENYRGDVLSFTLLE